VLTEMLLQWTVQCSGSVFVIVFVALSVLVLAAATGSQRGRAQRAMRAGRRVLTMTSLQRVGQGSVSVFAIVFEALFVLLARSAFVALSVLVFAAATGGQRGRAQRAMRARRHVLTMTSLQ
jgi:hypothetical protein